MRIDVVGFRNIILKILPVPGLLRYTNLRRPFTMEKRLVRRQQLDGE